MALTIAFIGFGEVGQLFARQLAPKDVAIRAFDVLFVDPAEGPALRAKAAEAGAFAADNHAAAVEGVDLVISAVTAASAVKAAGQVAPTLKSGQVYIDLNSVSPTTKEKVAAVITLSGAAFVEFSVMAPVMDAGIEVPILAGGMIAARIAATLNPLGMKIDVVSERIGVASATKLCRSIVVKGMEAIMVDLNLVASAAGVMPAVIASLKASYPGMDWGALVATMPGRVRRHGIRRAAEMMEAARMMEEAGLDGAFPRAVAMRHESFALTEAGAERKSGSVTDTKITHRKKAS